MAEGIGTEAEHATLSAPSVHRAQGYLLDRPVPLAAAEALCAQRKTNAAASPDDPHP